MCCLVELTLTLPRGAIWQWQSLLSTVGPLRRNFLPWENIQFFSTRKAQWAMVSCHPCVSVLLANKQRWRVLRNTLLLSMPTWLCLLQMAPTGVPMPPAPWCSFKTTSQLTFFFFPVRYWIQGFAHAVWSLYRGTIPQHFFPLILRLQSCSFL